MISRSEQHVSRWLRTALVGLPVGADLLEVPAFKEVLCGLEGFVPQVMSETPQGIDESDGIYARVARKTGNGAAEILGLCILLSDQTLVPIHLHLQVDEAADEINWLECHIGESSSRGMIRHPYRDFDQLFYVLVENAPLIQWHRNVTYGRRHE